MRNNKIHVVILAAGDGKRLNDSLPKQFLVINGKPLLFYTFNAFRQLRNAKFHLVLNERYVDHWNYIVSKNDFHIPHEIIVGGPTRFHSVKSSLNRIPDNTIVLVHDAVRPMVSADTINNVVDVAFRKGNAIPVVDIRESVRFVEGNFSKVIDRSKTKIVQTPQGFISNDLKKAYDTVYDDRFTDDAAVIEHSGIRINTVEGNIENIKITVPFDVTIAEQYLSNY